MRSFTRKKVFTGFLTINVVPCSSFFQTDYDFKGRGCLKQRVCIVECHLVHFLPSFNVLTVSLLHCLAHEKNINSSGINAENVVPRL